MILLTVPVSGLAMFIVYLPFLFQQINIGSEMDGRMFFWMWNVLLESQCHDWCHPPVYIYIFFYHRFRCLKSIIDKNEINISTILIQYFIYCIFPYCASDLLLSEYNFGLFVRSTKAKQKKKKNISYSILSDFVHYLHYSCRKFNFVKMKLYRMCLIEFLSVQRASRVISRCADACENCILYPIHQSSEYSCYTLIMRYYIKRV